MGATVSSQTAFLNVSATPVCQWFEHFRSSLLAQNLWQDFARLARARRSPLSKQDSHDPLVQDRAARLTGSSPANSMSARCVALSGDGE
jgi:hypothetical protein